MDFRIPEFRQCKFHSIGCRFMASDKEVTMHENNDNKHHFELFVIFMLNSDLETLRTSNRLEDLSSDLQYRIQQLENRNKSIQEAIDMFQNSIDEMRGAVLNQQENNRLHTEEIQVFRQDVIRNGNSIRFLARQIVQGRDGEAVIMARLEEIEAAIREMRLTATLATPLTSLLAHGNLRPSLTEQSVEVSVNIVTIHRYEEERQRAMADSHYVINSNSFFTSHGYKMCSRIYLNGDEIGTERCMTVFFVIMRGTDDASLPWPFEGTVTLQIFNQLTHEYLVIDSFRSDPTSPSFQKPTTKKNIGYGFLKAVPHNELQQIVWNDKLVLKLSVIT